MSKPNRGKNDPSTRLVNIGDNAQAKNTQGMHPTQRPRSLTMGPSLIFANAMGEPDAMAITEAWRPHFEGITLDVIEHRPWQ